MTAAPMPKKNTLKRRLIRAFARDKWLYLIMLLPAAYYIIFCYWPMYGVQIAFKKYNVRYFFYNGEEYVVLGEAHDGECDCECEHCDHHEEEEAVNLYIMKVVESEEDGEEIEEFLPVEDEDLLEKLIEVVQADFEADEELDDE